MVFPLLEVADKAKPIAGIIGPTIAGGQLYQKSTKIYKSNNLITLSKSIALDIVKCCFLGKRPTLEFGLKLPKNLAI